MARTKITETFWLPDEKLVVTHISGQVEIADIERWETSLKTVLAGLPSDSRFKIFVNLYGFQAVNLDAHKRFRTVIPLTLADYGWKVGYVDLFGEEAGRLKIKNSRGIRCIGAAHCHQDESKIGLYASRFARYNEQYFTDPVEAQTWIESLEILELV